MVRMMVQLTEEQINALKALAKARKVPVARLVRESVEHYVASATRVSLKERQGRARAIRSVTGKYHDVHRAADLSTNHDEYLDRAFDS